MPDNGANAFWAGHRTVLRWVKDEPAEYVGMKENLRKVRGFLKPPMSIKEAKRKGLIYLVLIAAFYMVRDVLLYIVLPLAACNAIF